LKRYKFEAKIKIGNRPADHTLFKIWTFPRATKLQILKFKFQVGWNNYFLHRYSRNYIFAFK